MESPSSVGKNNHCLARYDVEEERKEKEVKLVDGCLLYSRGEARKRLTRGG